MVMLVCLWLVPYGAFAQKPKALVVDIAEDHIDITTGFNGAHLVLFGVRKKKGDVAVVLHGPKRRTVVRKKDQILGAWLNRHSVVFEDVFSYYDYALSAPLETLLKPEDLQKHHIGLSSLVFPADQEDEKRVEEFRKALIRNKQAQTLYPQQAKDVQFLSEDLFRAEFYLSANMPSGEYVIHTYLIRNKNVIEENITKLRVAQVGSSAFLYALAYERSFLYSILCLMIAFGAGFGIHMLRK